MDLIPGPEIEARSFAIIDQEAGAHTFSPNQWAVVRRMVHATADFAIMPLIKFNGDPIARGMAALKQGAPIIADSTMMTSGLSKARLGRIHPAYKAGNLFCRITAPDVIQSAKTHDLPRSVFNIRSLKDKVAGGIVCIGNAPTALWEVLRLWEEEAVIPALVIGMPVGFVNVVETKQMLEQTAISYITVQGRRGGTPMAVAALNAISLLALEGEA